MTHLRDQREKATDRLLDFLDYLDETRRLVASAESEYRLMLARERAAERRVAVDRDRLIGLGVTEDCRA